MYACAVKIPWHVEIIWLELCLDPKFSSIYPRILVSWKCAKKVKNEIWNNNE